VERYTGLTDFGFLTAFIVGTILSPKFKAVKTEDGEKFYQRRKRKDNVLLKTIVNQTDYYNH
jgi:hypothetical protein